MKTILGSIVLGSAGLFFLATAWSSFSAPKKFGQQLGLTTVGADGTNEIRAQYGGFFLAMAVIDGLALMGIVPRGAGLLLNSAVFGGLIFGRLASLILDRGFAGYSRMIRTLFLVDGMGFVLSLVAYLKERAAG